MTGTEANETNQKEGAAALALPQELESVGIVMFNCNAAGEMLLPIAGSRPSTSTLPLLTMLRGSPLFRGALRDGARTWSSEDQPRLLQAVPGLWLCAMPRVSRRQRQGYEVAAIATPEFVNSEQFIAMCQTATAGGMDVETCRNQFAQRNTNSIERMAQLVRSMHSQHEAVCELRRQQTSLANQLAESYEEISLLHSMSQTMTMRDPPERFIARACQELLNTMPYAWIGLQLASRPDKLKGLAGEFIMAGHSTATNAMLRSKARMLLEMVVDRDVMVLDPLRNADHMSFRPLGHTLVVHPVRMTGEVIGAILACEKHGTDSTVSSIDIKMLSAAAAHMAIFLENAALYQDLSAMFLGTLEALTASIDAKDRYTCGHSRRVAHLTQLLAREVGMDDFTVSRCHIAGMVHDVGKIGVPEAVLLKPGRLNDDEFAWIRKHPEIGYRILKDIPQLHDVLPGVLHHHERWDGRGYPHQLAGESIPLMAQLIGLADSFDAMSSNRTYRSALSREKVLAEVQRCAGSQFDPDLAERFVKLDFTDYDALVMEHQAADTGDGTLNIEQRKAA